MRKLNGKSPAGKVGRSVRTREAARSWLELGIQPVPLKPNSKVPAGGDGWNTLMVSRKTLKTFFHDGQNLGGLWGEPSNWIVDIDLDWDEASLFARHYFPKTFTYGRLSRPESHYLFRCKGALNYKKILKTDKKAKAEVVVEIRSSGSQSVLPPSLHPSAERYEINHDLPFVNMGKKELERLVDRVAAGAILLRNFPDKGGRHDYIHAITGALMWGGWNEADVKLFMEAFLRSIEDEEGRDRSTTVKNTIEHFKKGDRIAGWRTLSQWLDPEIIKTIRPWLTPEKNLGQPPEVIDGEIQYRIPRFDMRLVEEVPGLVGDIARWTSKRSYLSQPAFDLATGLMCTALASCNKYVIQGWATPLQPYFMLLAPTAAGKGSSLDSIYQFAVNTKLNSAVFQGFQSYYALLDTLGNPPALACWLWDEAARRLKATRNPGSFDYQIVTWLLALYGKANSFVPSFPGRKNEIPALDKPWLGVFAAAQPDQLIEAVTTSDLAAGLLNRFVLFDSGEAIPRANTERAEVFPSSIKGAVKRIRALDPKRLPLEIGFESALVWSMFRDFDDSARKYSGGDGENEIWGRANQNALICAGTVAVGVNPSRPMITEPIARWAMDLIKWSIDCWTSRVGESTARTFRERDSKSVERYVRAATKFHRKGTSEQQRQMLARGLMPHVFLQKLCRHLDKRAFTEILDQLVESQLIGAGEEDGQECYWPLR